MRALAQFSVRCEKEAVDGFNDIHDRLGFSTKGETFGEVIERFRLPQVVADRTKELEQQLNDANAEVERLRGLVGTLDSEAVDLRRRVDEATARDNDNSRQYERNCQDMQQQIDSLQQELEQARSASHLPDGSVVIAFTAENLAVLDHVCNRESRRRNATWSRSHVINHFINSRFVKGELNGDLRSVSDSDIALIRKTLSRGEQHSPTDNGQQSADKELKI